MKDIASALIVGAGAVGCAVADTISKRQPRALRVLADAERLARYRSSGFIANGARRDFPLVDPASAGEADLIIVAVKTHHLSQAIADMRPCVGPGTLILSLLNGISSEDEFAAAFGREKVPYAVILGIDAVRDGNATRFSSVGKILFGDSTNTEGAWSERVTKIAAFFDRVGVPYSVPADMVKTLWHKFMINVGINQVSAVIRAPYGVFQAQAEAKAVSDAAMREVIALSRAMGTGLSEPDLAAWYKTLMGLGPEGKTSMLQDVEARRKTEVEAFSGTVVKLGCDAGVAVPVNETLFNLIRAIELGY